MSPNNPPRPPLTEEERRELDEFERAAELIADGVLIGLESEPEVSTELREWPVPAPVVFSGLVGDVVRALAPITEADPVALAAHLLVAIGSAANRTTYCAVGGTKHHLNENMLLIGGTAVGRKGTAKQEIDALFEEADDHWASHCVASGLSTGEGLIYHVRDASTPSAHGKGKAEADPGVSDKRLLVIEQEFASVLRVMKRESSTLSAVIRKAWDGGTLRTLTRNASLVATDAHISIVGHITEPELRRDLDSTDLGNGLVNRFIPVLVRRSQLLPEGGSLPDAERRALGRQLRSVLEFARRTGELRRDREATDRWHAVYADLSTPPSGLLGAVTSRAEAHVLRLSALYAVLDLSTVVRLGHLEAALAFWEYATASAAYVFGKALGDPLADKILDVLRSNREGVSRTEISAQLGRNVAKRDVDAALSTIAARNLARRRFESTGGRPKEWWTLVGSSFVPGEEGNNREKAGESNERNERSLSLSTFSPLSVGRTNNKEAPSESLEDGPDAGTAESGPGLEPVDEEYLDSLAGLSDEAIERLAIEAEGSEP